MAMIVIGFGAALIVLSATYFAIQWYNDHQIVKTRQGYLASLHNQYDDDQELEELIFDIDVSQYQFITYHDTLQ
jgi:hypothetical protein